MQLGDAHILMRIMEAGQYHVAVTYNVINGADISVKQWEHTYSFERKPQDVLSHLANLLAHVSHDIPQ